jgi:predicted O-linked N-acetylglucosamine transferase (SPINDLY family)
MAQYEALAVKLASDLPHLAAVRAGLRSRMACSPVCDLDRFAQKFAAALRQAWRDWCAART